MASKGFGSLVDQVEQMAKTSEVKTIDEMVADSEACVQIQASMGSAIIFDSIRAAMVDGLDAKEEAAILTIAGAFGIDAATVAELKELADDEEALGAKKAKIIIPGHPCLDAKYQ